MFFFLFFFFPSIVLSPFASHLNTSNQEEQDLEVGDTPGRIVARGKSGFGSMMEGFQNSQALPWEFRDPERIQTSDYV